MHMEGAYLNMEGAYLHMEGAYCIWGLILGDNECIITSEFGSDGSYARGLYQRAGGWCEPVQKPVFPLPEPVMKVTGSYPIAYEARGRGRGCRGNMGGNAEE